ncbi:MAG: hydroxyacid dehydrogenase [Halanaerobiaceae bacterium]
MSKGIYILPEENFYKIYSPETRKKIGDLIEIEDKSYNRNEIRNNLSLLNDINFIFSGWGGPELDKEILDAAPELEVMFYGSGSIKGIVTEEFWKQDIIISSAWVANAVPVAEYTLSQILFSLKRGWYYVLETRRQGQYPEKVEVPGAYGSTVGIISLGMIGKKVCRHLKDFDINVIAYDPYVSEEVAEELGVELCSTLEEVFEKSDVVSLHTPWLEETEGMIKGEHFSVMKENSTFINTARGAVVREKEMIEVLQQREDIYAVLDVTWPEPPEKDSPLYQLPNVVLTPHIAGSQSKECWRMGQYMLNELERYLEDKPLKWRITREKFEIMA